MPAVPIARAGTKRAGAAFDMLNTWLVNEDIEDLILYRCLAGFGAR